ncbi:hypothetical protein Rs2_23175 [Raphanus sativus]|nr:hypothetical protein Rs2_23175 [Raphanus sativus]
MSRLHKKKKVETEPSRKIFSLKELHSAIHICNYDNKLGEGRFGSVYWGQLSNHSQVAVKRLKAWSNREDISVVELEILSRIRQKKILSVRGYLFGIVVSRFDHSDKDCHKICSGPCIPIPSCNAAYSQGRCQS